MKLNKIKTNNQGLSLLEVVIGIAILGFVSISLYGLFDFTLKVIWENKARTGANVLANQYMEMVQNLPYLDVGTEGGIPSGVMAPSATTTLNNIEYTINTSVIYVDDPFDGTQGGVPDDTLPSDYKRVRIELSWNFRLNDDPVLFISDVAPRGLESELGGGTLRITAIDSLGQPVPQAEVYIVNNSTTPAVNLGTLTNDDGELLLPGATTSVETYEVFVTKTGYSSDQTYGVDPVTMPTSFKPHLSVIEGQVTDASFSIDQLSQMNFTTVLAGNACGVTAAPTHYAVDVQPLSPHRGKLAEFEDTGGEFYIALNDSIYVDGLTGSDTTGDGSSGNPYATITRALQDVDQGEGDMVFLAGSQTYNEGPISLVNAHSGATSSPTIIQAWPSTATPTVSTVGGSVFQVDGAANITLDGLAITGASGDAVVIENGSRNIIVSNSLISGNTGSGIYIEDSESNSILDSTLTANNGYGISLNARINTVQRNSIFSNALSGIMVSSSSNDIIENNVYLNQNGLDVATSDNLVNNNDLHQNVQSAVYIHHTSGQNTVSNNRISDNGDYGIRFEGSGTNVFLDNEVSGNQDQGIYIVGSGSSLSGNEVYANVGGGIYISGSGNQVVGDEIYDNDDIGVEVLNGSDNDLQDIEVHINDLTGVTFINCTDCSLTDSLVYGNLSHGIDPNSSSGMTFSGNIVYGNNGRGFYLNSLDNSAIISNLIYEQGSQGISISSSDGNTIELNTIADNSSDGISLVSSSLNNIVKNNIIAFNGGRGLDDNDDNSEPDDSYNLFYSNSSGDLRNLTPSVGGTGTATGTDPLFVDRAGDDYHLQSIKGYYPFGPGDVSAQHSPAIDAGDEATPYTSEPSPNGCRVNLGFYGGTAEASKSQEAGDPVPNLDFTLRGSKLKGWDSLGNPVYKYQVSTSTDASGLLTINDIEWDSYEIFINSTSTGYDIAYIDPYIPVNLLPNTTQNIEIGLVPDTHHSLHLMVLDNTDGLPEDGAEVRLYHAGYGYDETKTTPLHGQIFFDDLAVGTYNLEITKSGFELFQSLVDVIWYTDDTVSLIP